MLSRRQLVLGAFFAPRPAVPPGEALPDQARQRAAADSTPRIVAFAEHCLAFQNVVCRTCGESCPDSAIRFSPRLGGAATPSLIAERCTGCGDCLAVCPSAALSLLSPPAHCSQELVA